MRALSMAIVVSDLQKHGQTHMEDMERTTGTGETKCFLSNERYTSRS